MAIPLEVLLGVAFVMKEVVVGQVLSSPGRTIAACMI